MFRILWMLLLVVAQARAQAPNLVIVTIDGLRWQEVFKGADSALLSDAGYTPDTALQKALYWDADAEIRRKKLLPFFWSVLQHKAAMYGNRQWGNHVNVANPWHLSYAGYNEMFTGTTDIRISTNAPKKNRHRNIFDRLAALEAYKDGVAFFSSWNVFPYILNKERSAYFFNSAWDSITDASLSGVQAVQEHAVFKKADVRHDWLTWIAAKEYLEVRRPKVLCLALGETDEWAHRKRYDLYLHHANAFDRMLAELWNWLQTTEGYRNNTSLIITTDHGRGGHSNNWYKHGIFVPGSSQTWMVVAAPGMTAPAGELQQAGQRYQYEIPELIMELVNQPAHPAPAASPQTLSYAADKGK